MLALYEYVSLRLNMPSLFPFFSFFKKTKVLTMILPLQAAQWVQDLMMDLEDLEKVRADLRFRGAQGTTGQPKALPLRLIT